METPQELYKSTTAQQLLKLILESDIPLKFGQNRLTTMAEKDIVMTKLTSLIKNDQYKLLLRGITKSTTKEKLISRLNSNDSLYDGLFLVGDKAKNFLTKSEHMPHPMKTISSIGYKTASWIFDEYSHLEEGPIDLTFFKDIRNKQVFISAIKEDEELNDYYLFGLHTYNSDSLVNFVSTTSNPEVAFYNQISDKLVIFLWIPTGYNLYINPEKLRTIKSRVESKKLPILTDSFYPLEKELSLKGFILPHIIVGVHDLEFNELILNPALLNEKTNWLKQGFDIDQSNFEEFIKQTKYERFLILTDRLEERTLY